MTVDSRLRELEGSGPLRFGAHIYRATNQNIGTGAVTAITFSDAIEDANGMWSSASAVTKLRVPIGGSGIYLVDMIVYWDGGVSVTGPQIGCYVFDADAVGQSTYYNRSRTSASDVGVHQFLHETWVVPLRETWEIQPWVYHSSGGTRAIQGGLQADGGYIPRVRVYRFSR